ncbi:MAG: PAS domain S-box protein [Pontiellaceae bacterium]|nr:PAS domain S-box protein [Pontiellaceae bacterium]MBN2786300.1 PAS domain S-box protein [Pontiellaceae bacterium]
METEGLRKRLEEYPPLNMTYIVEEFVENCGALLLIKDLRGAIKLVNRKWEEVVGVSRKEALDKLPEELFPPEVARQFRKNDDIVLKDGRAIEVEEFLEGPTGRRYFIANKFPLRGADETITGLCGVITEITDRKRAEEALRESELLLNKSQSVARIGSYCLELISGKWSGSPMIDDIFGVDDGFACDVEGWLGLIHPDDLEGMSDHLVRHVLQEHKRFDREYRILRHDTGELRWVHGLGELEFDADGNPIKMIGTIQDITARKETEQSLIESEIRYKALHNASFGGIGIHDHGVILECNRGLCDLTGYSYKELIGMDGLLLIEDNSRQMVMDHIRSGTEVPYETLAIRKNGEIYPVRLEARNIPYKGKQVRTVEFRDLTDAKKAEREKEELERQLQQSQKMEAIGRLAGGVAHDFNNMLSVIIGHADLALDEVEEGNLLSTYLEEIEKAGRRSAELTRQLLAFARQQTVAPQTLNLSVSVSGMIRMLERLIGEQIELIWVPSDNVWPIKIDPSQIDQVLANLCVNARDAIDGVGKVTIETGNASFDADYCEENSGYMPGDFVYIAVSDTGCGMDAGTMNQIFEPFFTTKASGEGTGLGLSTIYGVVKQNDGFITVYSELGEGSTFKLYLPRFADTYDAVKVDLHHPDLHCGRGTIMLVEDEPAILRMTNRMLTSVGYEVIATSSPKEAIELAETYCEKIDMLMTDVVMPEMNGRDLARAVLSLKPDLKVLYMSGYTANVIAHHGVLDEGINFIQKPFSRTDLSEKVTSVMNPSDD